MRRSHGSRADETPASPTFDAGRVQGGSRQKNRRWRPKRMTKVNMDVDAGVGNADAQAGSWHCRGHNKTGGHPNRRTPKPQMLCGLTMVAGRSKSETCVAHHARAGRVSLQLHDHIHYASVVGVANGTAASLGQVGMEVGREATFSLSLSLALIIRACCSNSGHSRGVLQPHHTQGKYGRLWQLVGVRGAWRRRV